LGELWNKTVVLRTEPNEVARQSGELTRDRPYYVVDRTNGWTCLRVRGGGEGWAPLTELSQHDRFKELKGMILYGEGILQLLAGNYQAAAASFDEYLEKFAARQDAMNQALAHTLLGYSHCLDRSSEASDRHNLATRQFQAAADLLPDAASPVNCLAVTLFDKAAAGSVNPAEVRQLEKQLVHVIQTENDVEAVRNLQALYQLPNASEYFTDATSDFPAARSERMRLLKNLEQEFAH
jgi:tetratricopeptide (TPR) repeat protein